MNQQLSENTIIHSPEHTYRILRTLGQGGFGITYLAETTMKLVPEGQVGAENAAESQEATICVALKEFFMREVNGRQGDLVTCSQQEGYFQKYLEKFRAEAQNLMRLSHPNIISVIEMFPANNTLYYAMELIDGQSLQQRITVQGPLSETEALPLAGKIGQALEFMHGQRMLHLDLKPNNIMLRDAETPVLIDFGLSKQYDENGSPESSTTIGAGTQGYAPIEQNDYHGGRGFPVTLDIYALGATLYKMLTGVTPPVASSVMNDGLPLEPLRRVGVSENTIQVVKKAMMPMKAMRYQSVGEMLGALDERTSVAAVQQKKCPYCGEMILSTARKCRFCGEWLDPALRQAKRSSTPPLPPSPPLAPAHAPARHAGGKWKIAAASIVGMVLAGALAAWLGGAFGNGSDARFVETSGLSSEEYRDSVEMVSKEAEAIEKEEIVAEEEKEEKEEVVADFTNGGGTYLYGSVDDKYGIKVYLQNDGDHGLTGWIYYTSQGADHKMAVEGNINDGVVEFYEVNNGQRVGYFSLRLYSDLSLSGVHTNLVTGNQLSASLWPES